MQIIQYLLQASEGNLRGVRPPRTSLYILYVVAPMKHRTSSFPDGEASWVDCEQKSMTSAHLPASLPST